MGDIGGSGASETAATARGQLAALAARFSGPFRVSEAALELRLPHTRARRRLAYLAECGWLERVGHGLYVVAPLAEQGASGSGPHPWVLAARVLEPCVVTGASALHHWAWLSEAPERLVVVTARRGGGQAAERGMLVRRVRSLDSADTAQVEVEGQAVSVAGARRALVDGLEVPALAGGIGALKLAVAAYLVSDERDDDALLRYAERRGRGVVFKRLGILVEACDRGEVALVQRCVEGISRGMSLLDPEGPKSGPYVTRFGLRVNAAWEDEPAACAVFEPPAFYGRPPMGPRRLAELVRGGETLALEFKSEARRLLSDTELVEAVTCLANGMEGDVGWLVLGVEDDGTVTGARGRHEGGVTDTLRVTALIAARTTPSLSTRVARVELAGRDVLVIEVPGSRVPVGTSDGRYLRRTIGGDGKPACVPMVLADLHQRHAALEALDPCVRVIEGARWQDLEPLEFHRFRSLIKQNRGDRALLDLDDRGLAAALGALSHGEGVTLLGLLLFGCEDSLRRFVPTHELLLQALRGTSVQRNQSLRGTLLQALDEVERHGRALVCEREVLVGFTRVAVPNVSLVALREAVANALVHRDYGRMGAVHIQWLEDRVQVSSPGGFVEGVHVDNVLTTPPRPRNLLLADALKRAGIIERIARGVDTLFVEQLRLGYRPPHFHGTDRSQVVLTLPGGEPDLDLVRLVHEEARERRELGCEELLLLDAMRRGARLTVSEAARLVQREESDAAEVLARLVRFELLAKHGTRRYTLAPRAKQRLGGSEGPRP